MSENPLKNTAWRLTAFLVQDSVAPPIEGTELTAVFSASTIHGSGDCNQYGADYLIKLPRQISINHLGSTKRFCPDPPGTSEQEARYFEALLAAVTFNIEGDRLTLMSKDDQSGLQFEKIDWATV